MVGIYLYACGMRLNPTTYFVGQVVRRALLVCVCRARVPYLGCAQRVGRVGYSGGSRGVPGGPGGSRGGVLGG